MLNIKERCTKSTIGLCLIAAMIMAVVFCIPTKAFAGSGAGSISCSGIKVDESSKQVYALFTRTAPADQGIYSMPGFVKYDSSKLEFKQVVAYGAQANTAEKGEGVIAVSFGITEAPHQVSWAVFFKPKASMDAGGSAAVTWSFKDKLGGIQANVGPGQFAKGAVPISEVSGLSGDGTITAEVSVKAKYNVRFVDYDGTLLKKVTVREGETASPPADPSREGYTFKGWDGDYTYVQSNRTITALYSKNEGKVDVDEPEEGKKDDTISSSNNNKNQGSTSFVVTFHANGGSYTPEKQVVEKGHTIQEPASPRR